MKNIEQIKKEAKEATGHDITIFSYNGELGLLMNVYDNCYHTDFVPFIEMDTDNINYDDVTGLTTESDFAEDGAKITNAPIVNEQNEQKLIVDSVWSTINYNKSDVYVRELLVTTDRYYDWTSERRRMIDRIYNVVNDDEHGEAWKNERMKEMKNDWYAICDQYEDPCGFAEFQDRSIEFDDLISECTV